ncbi:MAG: N-acetylneuraminate synthase family protein [Candidatus Omnitrophota bacterium]|nr:N-acetylneuraminate synthase family protein [Candidatus Omnitrophota bacterium]
MKIKENKISIIVVIPAKADSKRLPNKNMTLIGGKPLLYYTIRAAKECKSVNKIYVSTDSEEIARFAKEEGIAVIMRPSELGGETPVVNVYRHALESIAEKDVTHIVALQPDHPDRTVDLEKTIRYALEKNLDDLISVDSSGRKNGSIRIMRASALREGRISTNLGLVMDNATNIHSPRDVRLAQVRLERQESPFIIRIKNKIISKEAPTFIISEGACNHMCDIEIAKKMIDEALAAGADAIKFQTYKAEKLVAKDTSTYWNYSSVKSQYEYYKKLDKFDRPEYKILFDYAKDKDIIVFSSPFDIDSADMLNDLGAPLFKIASCLITDKRLLQHIARFNKPIILSTGGSELDEIQEAVDIMYSEDNYSLILMACTLSYPTKNKDAHLLRIRKLTELFPEAIVGCSDHTEPDESMIIPSIAVALGAKVIEKHFTLDRTWTGSGHSFSVDPHLLKKMIHNVRLTEELLGKEMLEVKEAEQKTRESARMSIIARRDIRKGEVIQEDMLTVRRPGLGISPKFLDDVIGKKTRKDISSGEQLKWDDIE